MGRRLAATGLIVLGPLALAPLALSAPPLPRLNVTVFRAPAGARAILDKIAADGTAVGQILFPGGSSHSLYLSAHHHARDPLAGKQTGLVAIDNNDEAVGTSFSSTGTQPIFLSAGLRLTTLPMNGNATAIADGPLVAVNLGPAGAGPGGEVANVWNPQLGTLVARWPGEAFTITVDGFLGGVGANGDAGWSGADGMFHDLGFPGAVNHINLWHQGVGFATTTAGPLPFWIDLNHPGKPRELTLPKGLPYGTALDVSDSGVIVGFAFKHPNGGPPEKGVLWINQVTKETPLDRLVNSRYGLTVGAGTNATGSIVGTASKRGTEYADLIGGPLVREHLWIWGSYGQTPVNQLDHFTNGRAPTAPLHKLDGQLMGHRVPECRYLDSTETYVTKTGADRWVGGTPRQRTIGREFEVEMEKSMTVAEGQARCGQ